MLHQHAKTLQSLIERSSHLSLCLPFAPRVEFTGCAEPKEKKKPVTNFYSLELENCAENWLTIYRWKESFYCSGAWPCSYCTGYAVKAQSMGHFDPSKLYSGQTEMTYWGSSWKKKGKKTWQLQLSHTAESWHGSKMAYGRKRSRSHKPFLPVCRVIWRRKALLKSLVYICQRLHNNTLLPYYFWNCGKVVGKKRQLKLFNGVSNVSRMMFMARNVFTWLLWSQTWAKWHVNIELTLSQYLKRKKNKVLSSGIYM